MKLTIPLLGAQIHLRKRSRLRHAEQKREVPIFFVGSFGISYWSRDAIKRERPYSD